MCGYRLLRELGSRARGRYVASSAKGPTAGHRVVVELFEETEDVVRSARELAPLRHPKLLPLRNVVVDGDLMAVESDFVDGEWLSDLLEAGWRGAPMPLGALLRVLVDVLEGLSALHGASEPSQPLRLVHGEVAPANVLVGTDGVARLALPLRSAAASAQPAPQVIGYLAPEVLLDDQSADERADVFSAGALLWEMLAGRRLHSATHAGEIVVRLLGGKVQVPDAPRESLWGQPLAQAAKRALSPELAARYPSAAEMIAAVRWMSGDHLGTKEDVAGLVESLAGTRIRARAARAWSAQVSTAPAALLRSGAPIASPSRAAPSSALAGNAPTPVPPRSWPAPAMKAGAADEVDESVELELESDRPAETTASADRLGAVPKAPPLPRLSLPTPIIPMAALAAFARASASPAREAAAPAPPPSISSTSSAVVIPARFDPAPMTEEGTDAPIALNALRDLEVPRAPSRRRKAVLLLGAAVSLPALVGLAWLVLVSGGSPPVAGAQPPAPVAEAPAAIPMEARARTPAAVPAVADPAPRAAPGSPSTPPLEAVQEIAPTTRPATAPSSSTEPVAPPPLRKKSKTTYYPLGI